MIPIIEPSSLLSCYVEEKKKGVSLSRPKHVIVNNNKKKEKAKEEQGEMVSILFLGTLLLQLEGLSDLGDGVAAGDVVVVDDVDEQPGVPDLLQKLGGWGSGGVN